MKGKTDHGLSVGLNEFLDFVGEFIHQFFGLGCYLILRYPQAFHNACEHVLWKEQID